MNVSCLKLMLIGLPLLVAGCGSDEYPLKDDPDRTTSTVLNAEIVGQIDQQPSTWVEEVLPEPTSTGQELALTVPTTLQLIPGESVDFAIGFSSTPPSQNVGVHLRFGNDEEGYQNWDNLDPNTLLNAGQQLVIQLPVPEQICERLYPVVHQIPVRIQLDEAGVQSAIASASTTLDCSIWVD